MTLTLRMKPYIKPFERQLALWELEALTGVKPVTLEVASSAQEFTVSGGNMRVLVERLAYWETVSAATSRPTRQVLVEATTNIVRNGVSFDEIRAKVPFGSSAPLPNRRALRFGVHGIHEYRGKFFPQLVRSLLNTTDLSRGALVADPMCGSGTAIAEAVDAGYRAVGSDINPLSVMMAQTKTDLLKVSPDELQSAYMRVRADLLRTERASRVTLPYLSSLPLRDQDYMRRWFGPEVLEDLDRVAVAISRLRLPTGAIVNLLWLALSNVLRRVSWQKDDDLRVRREVRADTEIDAVREFLEELGRSVRTVYAFLLQRGRRGLGRGKVEERDARILFPGWTQYKQRVSAVITSPPYATALPYLDTDRLSLIYLKLLTREQHRSRDYSMIGNREITEGMRRDYLADLLVRRRELPTSVVRLVHRIQALNENTSAGFRRRNLPALLSRYFLDMRSAIENISALLTREGTAYLVVGSNSTTAGGQRIRIDTAALLGELGESCGLRLKRILPMEMLTSRDIFRQNASDSEVVLCFTRR